MWVEVLLLFLAVALLRHYLTTPRGMPPGPFVVPFLGSKLVITVQQIKECRKKYGDIFKSEMFGLRTVHLCNYELIKEAFAHPDITDRPAGEQMHFITDGVEAGTRYEFDDEDVLRTVKIMRASEPNFGVLLYFLFPKLAKMLPKYIREKWMLEDVLLGLRDENYKLGKELIESHRASLDPDHPRDVIDEYLLAMDTKSDIATYFNEVDLTKIIFDLFTAGFDTVSNTLRWFILFMAKYPDVQRRVQQQIDEVVPRDTLPSYEHKPKLPLVEATVHEVLRRCSLVALGVHHATKTDVHLAGYLIPKGTFVLGAAVCCHEDQQYWEQPLEFRLEHFLDEEGNFVSQKEGFLPFSTGRRNCLGEALARMELYVFMAALLQNFTFSAPEGCEVDLEPNRKQPTTQQAKEQNIVITARQ